MTYAAYTPGPWRLGSECDPPDGFVWAPDDDELVAVAGYDCSDLPTLTRAANARLIAAAPELLAALEDAFAFLRGDLDIPETELQGRLNAAITKAKGA